MSKEATLILFNNYEGVVKTYWLEGNYKHLDKMFINSTTEFKPLLTLLYGENGVEPFQLDNDYIELDLIPNKIYTAVSEGTHVWVINCGEIS